MARETRRGIKSTIDFPPDVWQAAKQKALDERTNFRSVVIEALRKHLRLKRTRKDGRA